jgi:hypothetical protein
VLAADTRSTSGSTVADKNCEKIHFIAPNIYCCGAGTAADTENVTGELVLSPGGGGMMRCSRGTVSTAGLLLCHPTNTPPTRLHTPHSASHGVEHA